MIDNGFRRLAGDLRFPEGPAFSPNGELWAVELLGGTLVRVAEDGIERFDVGGRPNGLAFRGEDLWFCDAQMNAVRRRRPDGSLDVPVSGPPGSLTAPNDLAFDDEGNLVFTCPGESRAEPTGSVWRASPDGRLDQVVGDLMFPNGLAFDAEGRLIVAETYRRRLSRGAWAPQAAAWSDVGVLAETEGPTGPDGIALDDDGRIYVAVFGRGHVAVFEPDGFLVETLPTPGLRPTNLAFDPTGRLGLVVTEAERGEILAFPIGRTGLSLS